MTGTETDFIIQVDFIFHILVYFFDSMFVLPAAMRAFFFFFVPLANSKGADKVKDLRVSTQTDFADLL